MKSDLSVRTFENQDQLVLPFKLIITDCNMPVMDGLEMGLEIKKSYQSFVNPYLKKQKKQIISIKKQYLRLVERHGSAMIPSEQAKEYEREFNFLDKTLDKLSRSPPYIVAATAYQGQKFEQRA
jgi:CheY-like chemotaxis protein